MGVVFLILYIIIIIAVVGFLLYLFFKYFDIHPERIKDVFYKIPKSKEAVEKFKELLVKLKIADRIKYLVENFKSALNERKQRRIESEALKEVSRKETIAQKDKLKVAYSNASNTFFNDTVKNDNYQMKNDFLEKLNAKRTGTDDQYVEQQKILNYQTVNSKPNTGYNNTVNTINDGLLPRVVPSNYKTTRPIIAEKETVLREPVVQQTPIVQQEPIRPTPIMQQMPVMPQTQPKQQTLVERLASEKTREERTIPVNRKQDSAKVSKKKKKFQIVQTGFASIFFNRANSIIIIPYAKDIEGKGRAMDGIVQLKYPIMPDELGKAVMDSIYISDEIDAFNDKELVKVLGVKGWEDFTFQKRHISIRLDKSCGFILNSTSRNPDGSYRVNCPGGVEKVVRKDASDEEIGDTVMNLLEKCKI